MLLQLAEAGGLFALLTFFHFVADWLPQSHAEAMAKSTNARVRAWHCAIYAAGMALPLSWFGLTAPEFGVSVLVLFVSHFIEDTYIPVLLWAKYIRKTPEFTFKGDRSDKSAFIEWATTPLGKILMIAVDQIIHLAFLWVPVYFALN
jgi:hypothetical protein